MLISNVYGFSSQCLSVEFSVIKMGESSRVAKMVDYCITEESVNFIREGVATELS